MALTTYAELKDSIASWMARGDLTDIIPDFITLFEAKANRRLRVRRMLTSETVTITAGTAAIPPGGTTAIPAGYLETKRLTWQSSPVVELEWVEPTYLQASYPSSETGIPRFYTIENGSLYVRPAGTGTATFVYYGKIPPLATATNWLLEQHPDLYLWGSLVEARAFILDPERAALFDQRSKEAFAEIIRLDAIGQQSQAQIRAYGPTP